MSSIIKLNGRYRATVSVDYLRQSKTFDSKIQAQAWARGLEHEAQNRAAGIVKQERHTVADMLDRYAREVSPKKRGARWEIIRIEQFKNLISWIDRPVGAVSTMDIKQWRDDRLKSVKSPSVAREWSLLSACFGVAVKEWEWLEVNPMSKVRKPVGAPARGRLWSNDEVNGVCRMLCKGVEIGQWLPMNDVDGLQSAVETDSYAALSGLPTGGGALTSKQQTAWAILFALETGMRSGEIIGLRWRDIVGRVAKLGMTKNGEAREVPLLPKAWALLDAVRDHDDTRLLTISDSMRDVLTREAIKACGFDNLHFHDLRANAATRISQLPNMTPFTLAKIFGWKNIKQAMTYFRETAEDVAARYS